MRLLPLPRRRSRVGEGWGEGSPTYPSSNPRQPTTPTQTRTTPNNACVPTLSLTCAACMGEGRVRAPQPSPPPRLKVQQLRTKRTAPINACVPQRKRAKTHTCASRVRKLTSPFRKSQLRQKNLAPAHATTYANHAARIALIQRTKRAGPLQGWRPAHFAKAVNLRADRRQVARWPKTPQDTQAPRRSSERDSLIGTQRPPTVPAHHAPGRLPISCAQKAQFRLMHPPATTTTRSRSHEGQRTKQHRTTKPENERS